MESDGSARQPLTREQKQRRKVIRQQLWDQLHSNPTPGQDAWLAIHEEWEGEEEGKRARWLGGIYICRFPPGNSDTAIQIEVDITEEITPVLWMIQTSSDNPFYPGRHVGKLEFSLGFPMEQIFIIWLSPIFSPFVRFTSGRGDVSSPFDLGKWSPYYTVQHVLQTIANFLTLQPLCREPPPLNRGAVEVPWQFSNLSTVATYAYKNEDAFYHAAQFFSRAYNRVSRESHDPPVLESQRRSSVTAIRELVDFYLHGRPPKPEDRPSADFLAAFNAVQTNNDWIAEERIWADALSIACGFGFFEP
jgi:ubiquitin-protein ligase